MDLNFSNSLDVDDMSVCPFCHNQILAWEPYTIIRAHDVLSLACAICVADETETNIED